MQRAASYPSVPQQPNIIAIAGSLLLVALSYVLLLAAPAVTRHFNTLLLGKAGLQVLESWLPLACGAGVVLGGASALVFVLTQVTREAQRRPYVALAPVLATFAACVLIGLRADLPLPGVSSSHVAVFAMALAVVGGALVQLPGMSTQLMGMACTFMPPVSLFGVLWVMSGSSDPAQAVWALTPGTRAFLGMLTMSSFAIGAVATLGRRAEASAADTTLDVPVSANSFAAAPMRNVNVPTYAYAQPAAYAAHDRGYALQELEESYADDEALLARRGLPSWMMGLVAAAVIGASVLAIKVYMDRRAATAFLERSAEPSRAIPAQPSPEPSVSTAAVAPSAAPTPSAASLGAQPTLGTAERAAAAAAAPVVPAAPAAEPRTEKLAETVLSPRAADEARASQHTARSSRSRSHGSRAASTAKPAPAPLASKPEKAEKAEARVEAKPAKVKTEPEDSASVALKAARAATKEEAKPSAKDTKAAAPVTRGDESLDELMDNVLKPAKGGSKKQQANDDPIYGL